ncbi:hypothetical protein BAUCODRAFT_38249 [Baudoinia panamericana UAMH 10762]|uniref:Uncharacterized protein n=1 Tax=Baudoinia panamericana (strain UAMH 10762) TaxID=717646 RepID=M2MZX6_BAUPA|nr:uncharacterized protein BAUCODRAFT_38249 [Baudoinia panamericana UAMH 10762]EMC92229.1 hypothetical protein BAUCODRAFT_38249 [Baudoinia panamericana UAMH 10762]
MKGTSIALYPSKCLRRTEPIAAEEEQMPVAQSGTDTVGQRQIVGPLLRKARKSGTQRAFSQQSVDVRSEAY